MVISSHAVRATQAARRPSIRNTTDPFHASEAELRVRMPPDTDRYRLALLKLPEISAGWKLSNRCFWIGACQLKLKRMMKLWTGMPDCQKPQVW